MSRDFDVVVGLNASYLPSNEKCETMYVTCSAQKGARKNCLVKKGRKSCDNVFLKREMVENVLIPLFHVKNLVSLYC